MKILVIVVLAAAALFAVGIGFHLRSQANDAQSRPPKQVYRGLRDAALSTPRSKIGLPPAATPATPWGVVMDWTTANGIATVVALSDGTASIYLSSGGGFIGGGQSKEAVSNAAKQAVLVAASCQPQALPTTTFPLPEGKQVIFYLLTDKGVFTASGDEQELVNGTQPLSNLAKAMQEIITQYRLTSPEK
jgi:hypothetical protein